MKKLTLALLLFSTAAHAQNVGINATGAAPAGSAMLDVSSGTTGILVPRVLLSSIVVAAPIVAPANSLLVFNTNSSAGVNGVSPGYYYWNTATLRWIRFAASADAWAIVGNAGTLPATNFIGTTDAQPLVVRTTNAERLRVLANGQVGVNQPTPFATDRFTVTGAGNDFAINGYTAGTGSAGFFQGTGASDVVVGLATAAAGSAGFFQNDNTAGTFSTLYAISNNTAPTLVVQNTSAAAANGDGIVVLLTGNSTNRGMDLNLNGTTNTGIGVAVFQNGNGRAGNFQNLPATNAQPALFASTGGTGRVINAQNSLLTHQQQVGFFSQSSTGLTLPAYTNAASVWGQSGGVRSGVFLAAGQSGNTTALSAGTSGTGNYDAVGIFGYSQSAVGWGYGVLGQGNWFGIFSNNDLGAVGLKLFNIDHPLDPENKYLRHFSLESNEPLNMYRGTVELDASGEAVVTLPGYFHAVNIEFSYGLTPVGAPMALYIAEEIDEEGHFRIAGGVAGMKASWNVYAQRNDPYVQQHPEKLQVEMDKRPDDIGRYVMPELYGKPASDGIFYRYRPDPSTVTTDEPAKQNASPEVRSRQKEKQN